MKKDLAEMLLPAVGKKKTIYLTGEAVLFFRN